jgi:NAD(P)-dependent dehydrogenase (short-subunit alcohol dehydrogenase family)
MHGNESPVAVVTGAGRARGIGRAIALHLARDGFAVVVHERSSDPARRTADEAAQGWLGAQSVVEEIVAAGGAAATVSGDLLDAATIPRLREVGTDLGPLAVLVNNHGSAGEANSYMAHETPIEVWDETVAVNLTSLHRVAAELVPVMAESSAPRRAIVNLTSTAGHRALGRYGAYCASKAAVERLTEQQAIELARYGIRVNAVAPGLTPTDMIDGTMARAAAVAGTDVESLAGVVRRRIPLRRFATTDDIASAVAFLAGPGADYITGQILTVDGGMTLA